MVPFPKQPQVNLPYLCPPEMAAWGPGDGWSVHFCLEWWWKIHLCVLVIFWLLLMDIYGWLLIIFEEHPWIFTVCFFLSMDMYRCLLIYGCLRRYEEHPWYFPGFLCLKEGCPGGFLWGANLPWVSVFRGELNIFSPTSWSIILLGIKDGNGISTGYHMISYDIMINGGV